MNRRFSYCAFCVAIVVAVAVPLTTLGQTPPQSPPDNSPLTIYVTPGGTPLFPIAIPDLVNKAGPQYGNLGIEGALALSHDLDYSFYFRILSPSSFLKTPAGAFVADTDFPSWATIGADALIVGEYTVDATNMIEVTLRLYDVTQHRMLLAKRYRGTPDQFRMMTHRFSDEVLFAITGTRGPFYSRIAFASKRTGDKEIYTADSDGKNIRQVTNNKSINMSPAFSPSANALVFTSYATGTPSLAYLDLFTNAVRTLYGGQGLTMAGAFAHDGSKIAFSHSPAGDSDLYVLDMRRNALSRITQSWGLDISPSYSPNDAQVAYVSDSSGEVPHIYVIPATGGAPRRISGDEYSTSPSWSPTGDAIAYSSRFNGQMDIMVAQLDGSGNVVKTIQVTHSPESDEDPVFSPDGRYLLFSSDGALSVIPARDGYESKVLLRLPGDAFTPAWSARLEVAPSPAAPAPSAASPAPYRPASAQ